MMTISGLSRDRKSAEMRRRMTENPAANYSKHAGHVQNQYNSCTLTFKAKSTKRSDSVVISCVTVKSCLQATAME